MVVNNVKQTERIKEHEIKKKNVKGVWLYEWMGEIGMQVNRRRTMDEWSDGREGR